MEGNDIMRMFNFIIMITTLMIVFNLAGINTTTGYLLSKTGIIDAPENFANSAFVLQIVAILALVTATGIIIGFFTKTSPEAYLVAPLASILVLFIGDILFILNYAKANYSAWVSNILLVIMVPIAIGYAITVIDWWRGVD